MTGIDFFDSVLATLIAGVCSMNLLLFLFYMITRMSEKNDVMARSRSSQNKADRPFWVIGCLISGSIWMVSTLLISGDFNIYSQGMSSYACVLLKIVLQYTFGYILWINLIIYRLFRLYMVHSWTVKPLHAMVVLSILQAPFLVFSVVALAAETNCLPAEDFAGYLTCTQNMDWSIPFYCLALSYLFVFSYFTFKVSKITGTFKDLKRYIFFCGLSFLFLIFDASMYLSDNWQLITLRRLQCFFVFCIVTAQSWSIFWSVLIRKRLKKPKEYNDSGEGSIMVIDEKSVKIGPPEFSEDELMGAPVRRTYSVNPGEYDTEHYSIRPGILVSIRPRESLNEIFIPEIKTFSECLTAEDVERLEKQDEFISMIKQNKQISLELDDIDGSLEALNQEISNPNNQLNSNV
jgi:hypothetical protein